MTETPEANHQQQTPELTPERLRDLNTLEIEIQSDFGPVLEQLNAQLGTNLEARGDGYHITIIGPTERKILDTLTEEQITELQRVSADIQQGIGVEVTGIGFIDGSARSDMREADKVKKTSFVTFDIPALQEFRKSLGLPPKDLHVTLGFENGDIHTHLDGQDERGKPAQKPIEKKPDPALSEIANNLPMLEYSGLDGQLKQKKAS